MWGMLYRALHQQPDSRHAARQTGRGRLHTTGCRHALQAIWPARAARILWGFATQPRDVWQCRSESRIRNRLVECTGAGHPTGGTHPRSLNTRRHFEPVTAASILTGDDGVTSASDDTPNASWPTRPESWGRTAIAPCSSPERAALKSCLAHA